MNFDGIIFDLDGTLWNATEIELKSINDIIKNEYNVATITIDQLRSVMGVPLQEAASILFKEEKQVGIQILEKSGNLLDSYLKKCKLDLLYDKVRETLNYLSKNYKLFIVSNCKKGYIETFLQTQNLIKMFNDFECNGNTNLSKGENIKLIIERNKIKNAVFVGDTISDKEATDFANIPFVYAAYGFGNVEEYNYKIESIDEIENVFNLCQEGRRIMAKKDMFSMTKELFC